MVYHECDLFALSDNVLQLNTAHPQQKKRNDQWLIFFHEEY